MVSKSTFMLIFFTVFCFTACTISTNNNRQVFAAQSGVVTFYRAGNYKDNEGNYIACYWVNNKRIDLTNSTLSKDAMAVRIFVEDGIIYIKGIYKDKVGNQIHCYWINGERMDSPVQSPPSVYTDIKAIFLQDGKIYTLGYYLDSYGNRIPCYWINEERKDLDSTGIPDRFVADRIRVQDGKVYVTGHYFRKYFDIIEKFYWVDGKRTDLGLGSINSIFEKDGVIYTAGSYKVNEDEEGPGNACYWINGERKTLPIPLLTRFSSVKSIYIHDEKIYMLGYYYIRKGGYNNGKDCYWVNGERTDLTPNSDSDIYSIFVDKNKIYTVGRYKGAGLFPKRRACYWVNGKRKKLSDPGNIFESSRALDIKVLNGNIYILGWYKYNENGSGYCYWVNGQRTDFVSEKNEYISDATFTIQE